MKLSIKKISLSKLQRRALYAWMRHYKLLFVLFFLILTGFVSYQWYRNLYQYSWTPEQRKAYLESTAKETAFQEEKFIGVLKHLEEDRQSQQEVAELKFDLFEGARQKDR